MSNAVQYNIRDRSGNVYGPADSATLAAWTQQGRIVAGMHVAVDGTEQWEEASRHPAIAHLFGNAPAVAGGLTSGGVGQGTVAGGVTPAYSSGATYMQQGDYAVIPKMNILALLSMIAGILSVPTLCCACAAWPLGLAAIVMGIIGLVQCSKAPERYTGKVLAWVGLASGSVGMLLSLGWVIYAVVTKGKP